MDKNKLYDVKNSSSTFHKIMRKYNKRKKERILSNKGYIVHAIEEKRQILQLEEKDDMYIYKETKNNANMNELLLNLYGNKSKNRYYDISKFVSPIKLERNLFFPLGNKDDKNNEDKDDLTGRFINKKGMMKLPLIFKNLILNKKNENKNTNILKQRNAKSLESRNILKLLSNKSEKNDENKKEKFEEGALKLNLSSKNKIKSKNISRNNENNIFPYSQPTSKSNKNILFTQYPKNLTIKEYTSKEIKTNKDNNMNNIIKRIKNELSLNDDYISGLTHFKEQLTEEEKQKRKYFNMNDYGCKDFKEKYNYLTRKYFNIKK